MESIEEIDLLFKSGNDVPVTRATITLEQWEAVKDNMEMTEELAREILRGSCCWSVHSKDLARLDGEFDQQELEALLALMRNKGGEDGNN